MAFIRSNINFLFIFILPVYFYIVQNSIQNKHTHVYANGIVISHSHPFDGESDMPQKQHDHSKTEICLYSALNFDFYETPHFCELNVDVVEVHNKYFTQDDPLEYFSTFLKLIPRGPPA